MSVGIATEIIAAALGDYAAGLWEALEFYADEKNYGGQGAPGNLVVTAKGDYWQEDVGHIAREALAAMQAEGGGEESQENPNQGEAR